MSWLKDVIGYGTHAARPAAGSEGRLYYETDTATLWRDSGTAWSPLSLGSGTPGLVKLEEVIVPSGGLTTIDFVSVPSGYDHLELHILGISDGLTSASTLAVSFNGDTTPANYRATLGAFDEYIRGGVATVESLNTSTPGAFVGWLGGTDQVDILDRSCLQLYIPDYDENGHHKIIQQRGMLLGPSDYEGTLGTAWWLNTAPITEIAVSLVDGAKFAAGSKVRLYGVV